jgi:hypothetical protein
MEVVGGDESSDRRRVELYLEKDRTTTALV